MGHFHVCECRPWQIPVSAKHVLICNSPSYLAGPPILGVLDQSFARPYLPQLVAACIVGPTWCFSPTWRVSLWSSDIDPSVPLHGLCNTISYLALWPSSGCVEFEADRVHSALASILHKTCLQSPVDEIYVEVACTFHGPAIAKKDHHVTWSLCSDAKLFQNFKIM